MISVIKEAVLKGLREWIESEGDHTLRIGRIKVVRMLLDGLEETANREIKPIDFPLYFFEKRLRRYAAAESAISNYTWFLIREDADPDVLAWASRQDHSHNWYVRNDGIGSDFPEGKPHPLYPGFGSMVAFGNKVTPIKRYYKCCPQRCDPDSLREGLRRRLGDRCWTADTLPRDINGEQVGWG